MKSGKKFVAIALASVMTAGLSTAGVGYETAFAGEAENDYVIVAKSEKAVKHIESKYQHLLEEEKLETDLLERENILVSKMTKSEAETIKEDQQVVAVEEDLKVSASNTEQKAADERKEREVMWNLKSIHVDEQDEDRSETKVKVALLDSGVDFQEGLEVKERINLIAADEEISPLFEDASNHGTSIASLMISGNGKVRGVNRNIELYSARILDENKQAPLSRVIEGIYWAIDKDVNIISISFGTNQYSEALKQAVDAANEKGILVIAAAGNQGEKGTGHVEYPAAFDNVVAVGSVDSQAKVSDFSSTGTEVDLVAPGEAVRATGAFGETMVTSGTSMAVPHVVGTASLLWQKDTSKSKDFIQDLLEESAKPLGDQKSYGKGMVDYDYAQSMYAEAEKQYEQGKEIDLEENTKAVKKYDNTADEAKVEGTWSGTNHQKYLTDKGVNLSAMKKGAVYPDTADSKTAGMTDNPDFHGYHYRGGAKGKVNYLASYRFMIKIGNAYGRGESYTAVKKSDIPGLTEESYNAIRGAFKSKIHAKAKSYSSNSNRKAFVFGVAMHSATDAFAHSTYEYKNTKWCRIKHTPKDNPAADNVKYQPRRFTMAYRVERNTLYRFQGKRKDVAVCHDFHAAGDTKGEYYTTDSGNKYYRIAHISKYAKEVHITDANVIKHYSMINVDEYE